MNTNLTLATLMATLFVSACGGNPVGPDQQLGSKTDRLTWEFVNSIDSSVDLRFFDQAHGAWYPSRTSYYSLAPGDDKTFELECNKGANICYGASVHSNQTFYWGVSVYGDQSCGSQGCCHVCDGTTLKTISLSH